MKKLKAIWKAFVVAFSIYSKIPMPRFNWESDDMKYHLCFFPWIGAVIGGVEWLWYQVCTWKEISAYPFAMVALAIPILITGGFHLDGFMDTCDARHSYQPVEKKLEILKDPHVGAFAVICVMAYLLLAGGGVGILYDHAGGQRIMAVPCLGFFLARGLSGISVVTMQGAKKKGMLQTFSDTAVKKTVIVILALQVLLCAAGMLALDLATGGVVICAAALAYAYYGWMSRKEFGGITGDLAGYFTSLAELLMLLAACILVMALG